MSERYHRNEICPNFGADSQQALLDARVVVVGAGGLGGGVLQHLVAAGVGHVVIVEFDRVSLSNLNRQILYTTSDIGESKGECAVRRLSALNPEVTIELIETKLTQENAQEILRRADIVVDCTDNYEVRYIMDHTCESLSLALVHASVEHYRGAVTVFHGGRAGGYAALYGDDLSTQSSVGVLSPVVGCLSSLQAQEVLKLITGIGEPLFNRLLLVDLLENTFHKLEI